MLTDAEMHSAYIESFILAEEAYKLCRTEVIRLAELDRELLENSFLTEYIRANAARARSFLANVELRDYFKSKEAIESRLTASRKQRESAARTSAMAQELEGKLLTSKIKESRLQLLAEYRKLAGSPR